MQDTDKQLRKLYELSLLLSGKPDQIIREIAGMIASFFDVRVVVLTEIINKELYFLCAHVDGELKTDLGHIPLESTPCALIKEGKQEQFFDQVSNVFPQVDFLQQHDAFFYYGVPAMDSHDNVISTTCLLDERHRELSDQDSELLRIFGQRIAMELERKYTLNKQALTEEALQHSQSQLYNLSNISPVGIFRADANGQYIYTNKRWQQFAGITHEQASAHGWAKAIHPDDHDLVFSDWEKAIKNGTDFELEFRFMSPAKKITWVVGRATPEKDANNNITGYIGVVTDITERKKQELENESIRHKLTEAQSIAQLGFFERDLSTTDTYWSEETYRILGTSPEQTRPCFGSFIRFVHPDDVALVKDAHDHLAHGGLYDIDYRIIKPDGSQSILHGEAKRYVTEESPKGKIIGTVQDITERKHIEETLNALANFSVVDDIKAFYQTMVYNLARAYNAQFAFIGLFSEGSSERISLQAIWTGKDFGQTFEYTLAGTPCADVLNNHMEMVPEKAYELYPEDTILADLGIESYYGSPLITPSGEKIGLVAVMNTKPMRMGHWTRSILGLFSRQIASFIEHNRTESKITASQKTLISIMENMQDVYYRTDINGKLIMISPSGTDVLGYEVDQVLGTSLADLYVNPNDRTRLLEELQSNKGRAHNFTAELYHKDGHTVWMSANSQFYYDEQGEVMGIEGVSRDITHQYMDNLQMRKMSHALEQTADMVLICNKKGIIEYVNPTFEKITGYSKRELCGQTPNILKSGRQDLSLYKKLWETILSGNVFTDVLINKKKDGSLFYQDETITPLKNDDGEVTHFIATGRDISQRMENEKHLQYIAHHDALTSLPNRVLFMDRIKHSLTHAKRNNKRIAVLFFDLDRFKNINDTLGHLIGDKLLIEIARRLKISIREDDSTARLGGDEFAVLIDNITHENDVTNIARKILNCLESSVLIEGHSLYTTASIGISLFPDDGDDADTLLKNADIAMYRAKELGKNNYQFYSKDMSTRAIERLAMENNLRMALQNNEFILHYQPQVDANTHKIVGMETLIRWQHPELGLVSPVDFIPLLEETGLIIDVGSWVLSTACQQLSTWIQAGQRELIMSINVSGRQFHAQDFHKEMKGLAEKYHLKAEQIELEITENILMDKQERSIENMNKLDELGFRIAIDDFGTGYSSLSYLQRFKIDTLKIDRSFIKDLDTSTDNASITSAIIAMAHNLHLNIVAEGVETQQQLSFLQRHNCQLIQGYYFSRPLNAKEMSELLEKGID